MQYGSKHRLITRIRSYRPFDNGYLSKDISERRHRIFSCYRCYNKTCICYNKHFKALSSRKF